MATIIIVDDSMAIRQNLRQIIESDGHAVIEAEDGRDGLNKIIANPSIDLLISDYNMPGMDGISMIREVRETLGPGKFPIFMLTTETSASLKTVGKEVGVAVWITKPVVPDTLKGLIKKILERKAA